jgi:hypothetical protein
MALFKPAEVTSAYLKMGLLGFAGSGKTKTADLISIGLIQHLRKLNIDYAGKPVYFIDTETGSDWIKPDFDAMGVPLMVAKTRAFVDLLDAVKEAEKNGAILIADSVTHFWKELCDSYVRSKSKGNSTYRLQFQDWGYLKGEWGKFTDSFVNSNLHIILCGRAGFEYDYFEDEDGKKQLEKTGVKMKAEGEMGYEPSLLVMMERHQKIEGNRVVETWREASILKDRSTLLDGKTFAFDGEGKTLQQMVNHTFGVFKPHIDRLSLGGKQLGVDTTRTSAHAIQPEKKDWTSTQRQIALEEIEALLVEHYPSTSKEDKQAKAALIFKHFETRSWTEVCNMRVEELKLRYDALHQELAGAPSRYAVPLRQAANTDINDSLPDFDDATTAPAQPTLTVEDKVMAELPNLITINDCLHVAQQVANMDLSAEALGRINTALMKRQNEIAKGPKPDAAEPEQGKEPENTDGQGLPVDPAPNDGGNKARARRAAPASALVAG